METMLFELRLNFVGSDDEQVRISYLFTSTKKAFDYIEADIRLYDVKDADGQPLGIMLEEKKFNRIASAIGYENGGNNQRSYFLYDVTENLNPKHVAQ